MALIPRTPFLLALTLMIGVGTASAQDRPPIALPGPSLAPTTPVAPRTPAAPQSDLYMLAMAAALEQSGCVLLPANNAAILSTAGLTPEQAKQGIDALIASGMATANLTTGGIALAGCTPAAAAQTAAPQLAPDAVPAPTDAPEAQSNRREGLTAQPEDDPSLTLWQRRRCEDRPGMSFCRR